MNKELESRAKKYAEENVEDTLFDAFLEGATDIYIEKQKLEFTIKELMWVNILIPFEHQYAKNCIDNKIKELEQKLSEL